MTDYKPLTPKFRSEILDSINSQVNELNTCQTNAFVSAQMAGLSALENLMISINATSAAGRSMDGMDIAERIWRKDRREGSYSIRFNQTLG